ncbi:MAG: PfkB family carbohydrate kinase [Planctomycetota bacterium]
MTVLVTGTIGIDTVETPAGDRREGILGGSCAYFTAAASFFSPVRVVAAVGDDFPAEHRATLEGFKGVDLAGLETRAGSKTFRWGGKYQENMDHRDTLFTELGVLEESPPTVPASFGDSRVMFLANSHPGVQAGMQEQVPNRELVVADTMDLWIDIARPDLEILLGKVDGLALNYDEAEQFTGLKNVVAAGRKILEYGPRFVVVKKGEHGCILVHKDGITALPAYPAETVVDPTGAGDTFAGGMMGWLADQPAGTDLGSFESIRKSLAFGTIIASFTIEKFSLERLSELDRAQVDARLAEYAAMLRVD